MDVYGLRRRAILSLWFTILMAAGLLPYPAGAQGSPRDFVYGFCNTAVYSSNGSFAHHLNLVLGDLQASASKTLYALAKSESGPSSVYAMYQCRGDLSLSACSSCVYPAAFNICGPVMGVRAQFVGCFLRYENFNFSAEIPDSSLPIKSTCSDAKDSSSLYHHNLAAALNSSASAAPTHALFGYNASSAGTGSTKAFALTQCLGYASPSQCALCLSHVSNYSTLCNTSVSGQVYYDQCSYVYNDTSFLFSGNSTGQATTPSPAPTTILAPVPALTPAPVPSTAPSPTLSLPPAPPPPVLNPPPSSPPRVSSNQETSKKGNGIISVVVTLMASSLCFEMMLWGFELLN